MRRMLMGVLLGLAASLGVAQASEKPSPADPNRPWTRPDRAIVIDAYEYNQLDWQAMTKDKRIVGFINKASDGLPPAYFCSGDEAQYRLCKALWYRHAVAKELYQTRRVLAKSLGLKWGAYHLARPGNPVQQAQNFLDFAKPADDDLMAIDLEDNDPEKWMSLDDAELFVAEIKRRTGRYPVLYTNGNTAQHIADRAGQYKTLSRLQLWYARYKPEVGMHFPKGNWDSYALWQFVSQSNCNLRSCPMKIEGTNLDIDVNVADMTPDELRAAWPFSELVPPKTEVLVAQNVPVPYPRDLALIGDAPVRYAAVDTGENSISALAALAGSAIGDVATAYFSHAASAGQTAIEQMMGGKPQPVAIASAAPAIDTTTTASIGKAAGFERADAPILLLEDRSGAATFGELFGPDAAKAAPRAGQLQTQRLVSLLVAN